MSEKRITKTQLQNAIVGTQESFACDRALQDKLNRVTHSLLERVPFELRSDADFDETNFVQNIAIHAALSELSGRLGLDSSDMQAIIDERITPADPPILDT